MRKGDFAWALAAVLLSVSGGKITQVAIAVAGVGDRACRLPTVEAALTGQPANNTTFAHAGALAGAAVNPFGDAAVSAEYRKDLIRTLVERALADAA
jgi:aerobic carbon-monoxide dehydrogenase medium subunit